MVDGFTHEDADHAPDCSCASCELDRRLWHSLGSDDGECDCEECVETEMRIHHRLRLIARLKRRVLDLGGPYLPLRT